LISLALILLLGASNLFLWQRLNRVETDYQQISDQYQNTLRTVPLMGTDVKPDAIGLLVISKDGTHGTVVVDRLPVLDETQEYQLWLIKDGQRTSGGVFSVDEDGYGAKWIGSPDPLASYQSFGLTIEPAGGSPAPTGEKVLGGDL
jgi:anti-sigma-K factor RskA